MFGSVARGESGDASDIDLLVNLSPGRTLIDLAAFRREVAEILDIPVDVATVDMLKERIRVGSWTRPCRYEPRRARAPEGHRGRDRRNPSTPGAGRQGSTRDGHGLLHDALLFQFVVIGEAVKHLAIETRESEPEIPWADIAGLRDLIAHEYFRIDIHRVLEIVDRDLPPLEGAIERMLGME